MRPSEGQHQFRALLRGDVRVLGSLLAKARDALAARYYLRACTHVGRYVRVAGRPLVQNAGTLIISERTIIQSTTVRSEFVVHPGGHLEIGPRTWIHYGCSIGAHELVRIGADCHLGPYTNIIDNTYHDIEDHLVTPPSRPVIIGDNVWIGTRVIILPGVTIGDRAVIGAGAVVTKDVPPRSVAAGNPARVLRSF
ncbi:MAG: acyltransferase [Ktedonobacterales bacterium]